MMRASRDLHVHDMTAPAPAPAPTRRHFLATGGIALGTVGALASATRVRAADAGTGSAPPALPASSAAAAPVPPIDTARFPPHGPLAAIRARPDRLIDIAVCTRPFRAQGPRMEVERAHGKVLVHNYGHGGSGWSLSWGCARHVRPWVLATGERQAAVVGCGAIGLTTARVLQRAGLRVTIYAKDRPPEVRSSAATGLWTPDSRLITEANATPDYADMWERITRDSFKVYQSLLGLPEHPVEWHDGYVLSDVPFEQSLPGEEDEPDYAELEAARTRDLRPRSEPLAAGQHPFKAAYVRRYTQMMFNIPAYARMLMDDFLREGGHLVQREFTHPRQFAGLPERVIVNATGYGARALLGDESIVPVRGQTARLIPQPEVDYGVIHRGHNLVVVPRRDGLLVASNGPHDFGNADATPDRAQSEAAVLRLAALFA